MSDPASKPGSPVEAGGFQLTPKMITALVIAACALVFVFSNTEDIPLHFLWFEISAPGWVMLLALFVGGLAVGFFLGRNRYRAGK